MLYCYYNHPAFVLGAIRIKEDNKEDGEKYIATSHT